MIANSGKSAALKIKKRRIIFGQMENAFYPTDIPRDGSIPGIIQRNRINPYEKGGKY